MIDYEKYTKAIEKLTKMFVEKFGNVDFSTTTIFWKDGSWQTEIFNSYPVYEGEKLIIYRNAFHLGNYDSGWELNCKKYIVEISELHKILDEEDIVWE